MKSIFALKMMYLVYKLCFHDHLDMFYLLASLVMYFLSPGMERKGFLPQPPYFQ